MEEKKIESKEELKLKKRAEKLAKKEEKQKLKELNKKIDEKPYSERTVTEKAIAKNLRKENSDKMVILAIVLATVVIAGAIFGWYFYKSNLKPIVAYDGGTVTKAEYKLYYDRYIETLVQYYGYSMSEVPKALAEKAAMDEILLKEALGAEAKAKDEDVKQIEDEFKTKEVIDMFNEKKVDIDKMKQMYLNDLTIYAYIERLAKDANDTEILAYLKETLEENSDLNEYNTKHILFKTTDENNKALADDKKAEIKAKAEEVLKRALAGEDFATLAKEFSDDTGTKVNGGIYVMYDNNQTTEQYVKAVKQMKTGQVYATLVETDYGYHIIKLESVVTEGLVKSQTEREYYVQDNLAKITETKNVKINIEEAIKLIENLSGQKIEQENTNEGNNTENNTENNTAE